MTIDIDAIRQRVAQHQRAIGPGGEKAYRAAQLANDVPTLLAAVDEQASKIERRRLRLVEAENDLLNVRGILSPNGHPRRVPVELVPTVAPAVEWLANRVDELTRRLAATQPDMGPVEDQGDQPGTWGEREVVKGLRTGAAHSTLQLGAANFIERLIRERGRLTADLHRNEKEHGDTIDDRDRNEQTADNLAEAIAKLTGVEIGEHSSMNNPWDNALQAATEAAEQQEEPSHQPVTFPDGSQMFIHECRHIEWWNEKEQGPVNDQGCDACESSPFTGGWQPVYVRKAAGR